MKIHFIGIGGIGMSALARYYLSHGFEVSGSDAAGSKITEELAKEGAEIFSGHKKANIKDGTDLIIYSAAVPEDNPELEEAKKLSIKCQTYGQALGELTKKMWTIAISGTHGKSTTTAMIGLILERAGFDPTVIVGTKLREWGNSNCRVGKSEYLVIEADEYTASFLNYWPKMIVLTNIEEDHLDYYKDLKHILATFKEYLGHLPKDGILVVNEEDENISEIITNFPASPAGGQYPISNENPKFKSQIPKYRIEKYNSKFGATGLSLKIPGRHNLMNAYAAITAARALEIPDDISLKALNEFNGTWRRFEYRGMVNGARIYDDYAHHPTEIKATLQGAREYLNSLSLSDSDRNYAVVRQRQLWCVFQPHQFQRTSYLFDNFVEAFDEADVVVSIDIYSVAGREKPEIIKSVSSQKLAEAIEQRNSALGFKDKKIIYLDSFEKAEQYLKENLKKRDMAIIMGAGDIYKLTEGLIK
ncbi:MAG: UDP-N-acetylmuramate--L-alanine ligase [Candidatus Portnoybacteria bacterium]|nr:UDP-N-acetylmuramate--L-alanine ligase [Candidatus Portnoybacteria bacterium]